MSTLSPQAASDAKRSRYRIFGEMLEMAMASGLKLPPLPTPIMPTSSAGTGAMLPEHFATPTSSSNPLHVLQQPAFYFYTAAICSVQRQKRYQAALDVEVRPSYSSLVLGN